jgi:Zn-finger protein
MKKFKVTACYYTWCTAEIEAETEEQAYEIARDMDGGDFTDSRDCHDWHINDVVEIESC